MIPYQQAPPKNGSYKRYDAAYGAWIEEFYINGKRSGPTRIIYNTGLWIECVYKNDELNGLHKKCQDGDKRFIFECFWINNISHGLMIKMRPSAYY